MNRRHPVGGMHLLKGRVSMQCRKILVTGSSGFIGSQLVHRLKNHGHSVLGVARRQLHQPDYVSHDLSKSLAPLKGHTFDVVIHAAARSSPWGTWNQFYRDNVAATQNVLEFCQSIGSPRLIFVSSSSVYYRPQHQLGITEETPLAEKPVNHYARTKQLAESLVSSYRGSWAILRPRAVYGPEDTVLLPRIVNAARQGRLPLLVADDRPVIGDLIYIDNLLDTIESAVLREDAIGAYNLTNGEPVEILDFLFQVFDGLNIPRPTRRVSAATAMVCAGALECFHKVFLPSVEPAMTRFGIHVFRYSKTFDVSLAKSVFGPARIENGESLSRTIDWFRKVSAMRHER